MPKIHFCLIAALFLAAPLAFPVTMVESPALGIQTTLKFTYPVGVGNISLLINTAQGVFRDSCYLTITNSWQGFRIGIYDTTNNSLEGWQYGSPGWQQTLSSNQCSVDLASSTRTNDGYSERVEIRITKGSRLALGNASVVADYWYQYCTTYCNNENAVVTVGFWYMTGAQGGARLTNPVAGSILPGTTTSFQWERPSDVESVCIRVGPSSSPSANPVQCGSGNSATFTNLPSAGQTVYVTLQSQTANGQISNTYTLYAMEQNTPSSLTSPASSTVVNAGSAIDLVWTNGFNATGYAILAGTSISTANVLAATFSKTTTRARLLVPSGAPYLYVRLVTKFSNGDVTKSSAFRISATSPAVGAFEIISPLTSSPLSDQQVTFQWTALAGASEYYLFVGSAPGRADIFPRATRPEVLTTNSAVVDLRSSRNGRPVYVKVLGRAEGQSWKEVNTTEAKFATANLNLTTDDPFNPVPIAIMQPPPGSTLAGPTLFLFNRGTNPNINDWTFTLGSQSGGNDLYNSFGSELNQFRTGESAFVDTIPGSVSVAFATLSVKVGDSWYTTTAQYSVQVPTPSSSAISQFETCISSGTATECVLPAGIYAFDLPASGIVGRFHITRSNLTVRGEGIETQEPFAAPAARTRLWRRSGCAPLISVAAGVQNVLVERMTLDGNNDVLANTCLNGGQPGFANDMYVHGRANGAASAGQATSGLIIQKMYFLDAVGRSLTIYGSRINDVQVLNSYFFNAALTGALIGGSGEGQLIQPDPDKTLTTRTYQCDKINVNTDSDLARSVPHSIYFRNSYFANSWTGAIAFNSVFDHGITGSYFAFNYFNPYDYAGGTIFHDRCAASGTVSNSTFDGTGLATTSEGLEVHAARMTISGNTFRSFPGGGIVLHSTRGTVVANNSIENNGLDWWDGSPGITVAIRVYDGLVGRLTEDLSITSNTIGNTGGSTLQRFGIKFSGCLEKDCTSHQMGTVTLPIRVQSNTFVNNLTAPACTPVALSFSENVVSSSEGQTPPVQFPLQLLPACK